MGRGAMAAQQTLDLFILVRIRAPQPLTLSTSGQEPQKMAPRSFLITHSNSIRVGIGSLSLSISQKEVQIYETWSNYLSRW